VHWRSLGRSLLANAMRVRRGGVWQSKAKKFSAIRSVLALALFTPFPHNN